MTSSFLTETDVSGLTDIFGVARDEAPKRS